VVTDLRRKILKKDTSEIVKNIDKKQFISVIHRMKGKIGSNQTKKEVVLFVLPQP